MITQGNKTNYKDLKKSKFEWSSSALVKLRYGILNAMQFLAVNIDLDRALL